MAVHRFGSSGVSGPAKRNQRVGELVGRMRGRIGTILLMSFREDRRGYVSVIVRIVAPLRSRSTTRSPRPPHHPTMAQPQRGGRNLHGQVVAESTGPRWFERRGQSKSLPPDLQWSQY